MLFLTEYLFHMNFKKSFVAIFVCIILPWNENPDLMTFKYMYVQLATESLIRSQIEMLLYNSIDIDTMVFFISFYTQCYTDKVQ